MIFCQMWEKDLETYDFAYTLSALQRIIAKLSGTEQKDSIKPFHFLLSHLSTM